MKNKFSIGQVVSLRKAFKENHRGKILGVPLVGKIRTVRNTNSGYIYQVAITDQEYMDYMLDEKDLKKLSKKEIG